jgi:hypothetical protein
MTTLCGFGTTAGSVGLFGYAGCAMAGHVVALPVC